MSPKRRGKRIAHKFKMNEVRRCLTLCQRLVQESPDYSQWVDVRRDGDQFTLAVHTNEVRNWFEATVGVSGALLGHIFRPKEVA